MTKILERALVLAGFAFFLGLILGMVVMLVSNERADSLQEIEQAIAKAKTENNIALQSILWAVRGSVILEDEFVLSEIIREVYVKPMKTWMEDWRLIDRNKNCSRKGQGEPDLPQIFRARFLHCGSAWVQKGKCYRACS